MIANGETLSPIVGAHRQQHPGEQNDSSPDTPSKPLSRAGDFDEAHEAPVISEDNRSAAYRGAPLPLQILVGFATCCNMVNLGFISQLNPQDGGCTSVEVLSFSLHCAGSESTDRTDRAVYAACLYLFTVESALLQLFAFGGARRYWRSKWDCFNGCVCGAAWAELLIWRRYRQAHLALMFRAVDLLRAAKEMGVVHGFSVVLTAINRSFHSVLPPAFLFLLLLFFAATLGTHLLMGAFQQNCFSEDGDDDNRRYEILPADVNEPIDPRACGGQYLCPSGYRCYMHGTSRASNITYANPDYGLQQFNSFGAALRQMAIALTSSAWPTHAQVSVDAVGFTFSFIFYTALVSIGNVLLMKLFLASVKSEFKAATDKLKEKQGKDRKRPVSGLRSSLVWVSDGTFFKPCHRALDNVRRFMLWHSARIEKVVRSELFESLTLAVIVANTVTLSIFHVTAECEKPTDDASDCTTHAVRMKASLYRDLFVAEYFFAAVFFGECVLKMAGLGVAPYFARSSNILDFCIVALSIADVGVHASGGSNRFHYFRALRILRLFRFRNVWQSLDCLLTSISEALMPLFATMVIFFVFFFFSCIIGMFLFGTGDDHIPDTDHQNYLSFGNSALNVFQVFIGFGWPSLLTKTMHYSSESDYVYPAVYFSLLVVIGQFVLFSGFISQLLLLLDLGDPAKDIRDASKALRHSVGRVREKWLRFLRGRQRGTSSMLMPSGGSGGAMVEMCEIQNQGGGGGEKEKDKTTSTGDDRDDGVPSTDSSAIVDGGGESSGELEEEGEGEGDELENDLALWRRTVFGDDSAPFNLAAGEGGGGDSSSSSSSSRKGGIGGSDVHGLVQTFVYMRPTRALVLIDRQKAAAEKELRARRRAVDELHGVSLGIFGPNSRVRWALARLLCQWQAEAVVLALIVGSCVLLAMEGGSDMDEKGVAYAFDIFFTSCFAVELLAKVIVHGLLFMPREAKPLLRDGWDLVDLIVVGSSIIGLVPTGASDSLSALRSIRVVRVLRPLRAVRRMPSLRVSIDAILSCGPVFLNIMFVAVLIYYVFAVFMMYLFAGKFWRCSDDSVAGWSECIGTYHSPGEGWVQRKWENSPMNFDNIGAAMLTSFMLATKSEYTIPMWNAMDARKIDEQPEFNSNFYASLAFVVFILLASYLVMTLFVGAIIGEFRKSRDRNAGISILSENQKRFASTLRMAQYLLPPMRLSRPPPNDPSSSWWDRHIRWPCYRIVSWGGSRRSEGFENAISFIVAANAAVMAAATFKYDSEEAFWLRAYRDYPREELVVNSELYAGVSAAFTCVYTSELVLKVIAMGGFRPYLKYNWNRFDIVVVSTSFFGDFVVSHLADSRSISGLHIFPLLRLLRLVRLLKLLRSFPQVLLNANVLVAALPAVANLGGLLAVFIFMFSIVAVQLYGEMDKYQYRKYGSYNAVWNYSTLPKAFFTNMRWAFNGGGAWATFCEDVMVEHPSAWLYFVPFIVIVTNLLMNLIVAVVLEEFALVRAKELEPLSPKVMRSFANVWADYDPDRTFLIRGLDVPLFLRAFREAEAHREEQWRRSRRRRIARALLTPKGGGDTDDDDDITDAASAGEAAEKDQGEGEGEGGAVAGRLGAAHLPKLRLGSPMEMLRVSQLKQFRFSKQRRQQRRQRRRGEEGDDEAASGVQNGGGGGGGGGGQGEDGDVEEDRCHFVDVFLAVTIYSSYHSDEERFDAVDDRVLLSVARTLMRTFRIDEATAGDTAGGSIISDDDDDDNRRSSSVTVSDSLVYESHAATIFGKAARGVLGRARARRVRLKGYTKVLEEEAALDHSNSV